MRGHRFDYDGWAEDFDLNERRFDKCLLYFIQEKIINQRAIHGVAMQVGLLKQMHIFLLLCLVCYIGFCHLRPLSCATQSVDWRCKGLPMQNELALEFSIDFNKGFYLDARTVFASCKI